MERFAIKIDKKLKANLYKICRLCGIDNPDMVPILTDKPENTAIDVEAEMEMAEKINLLLGLSVTKDDKMPQSMCYLCVDKINDFYEFREMCYSTNAQTRKLLGLKNVKKPTVDIKPKVEIKEESIVPTNNTANNCAANNKANRKRKPEEVALKEEIPATPVVLPKKKLRFTAAAETSIKEEVPMITKKKLRFTATNDEATSTAAVGNKKTKTTLTEESKWKKESSPPEPAITAAFSNKKLKMSAPSPKELAAKKTKQKFGKTAELDVKEEIKEEIKEEETSASAAKIPPGPKLKFGCNICKERFAAKNNLDAHTRTTHIPKIERFVCTACNEVLSKSFDIKNHQLWHKLSKTPYVCGCCGESILNTYAFSRHLREHAFETPPALLVLDRECPQCHTSYATNYLYNIHICAVKTKRCAGCNRLQRNDAEYIKHSAQCAKVYLNYSKHIMPSVEALEDAVRIKNENDVEAAAEEMARLSGVPLDMAPVVQLTRLSSPIIMAANQCVSMTGLDDAASTSSKRSGKKGVSKKDLKRVDELLKSTLDALVSIKHEPEVHVEPETPCAGVHSDNDEQNESHMSDHIGGLDDYHHNADDSDYENEPANTDAASIAPNSETYVANETTSVEQIKIKQEIDEINEENANKIGGGGLKLKIKKEHGQLNSSIIEQQKSSEKRAEKRKKKKKHKDKEKEKQKLSKELQDEQLSQDSNGHNNTEDNIAAATTIRIKTEPQDGTDVADIQSVASTIQIRPQPEATIMTSIPMMQFQIACVSSGVEFNGGAASAVVETSQRMASTNHEVEPEDVKPNREELDRMMKISHVSSGIAMETDDKEEQHMDHDGNDDEGNGGDVDEGEETDYHEESNEDDHHDDNNESAQHQHIDEDQEAEEEAEDEHDKDIDKTSEDTGIDNEYIIAKKIKKPLNKNKLTSKPKVKPTPSLTKSRNKACKSTAKPSNMPVLQITAVRSGVTLEPTASCASDFIPIFIKPEPQNRGYSDEQPLVETPTQIQTVQPQELTDELSNTHTIEEKSYISSIDFNNITIKQEKDIEINDVHISQKSVKSYADFNGIKRKRKPQRRTHGIKDRTLKKDEKLANTDENMEADEEHATDDEVDEEENDDEEETEEVEEEEEEDDEEEEAEEEEDEEEVETDFEEEREYRELEYPPALEKEAANETEEKQNEDPKSKTISEKQMDVSVKENMSDSNQVKESNMPQPSFVIASVCSQVAIGSSEDIHKSTSGMDNMKHTQGINNHNDKLLKEVSVAEAKDDPNKSQTLEINHDLKKALGASENSNIAMETPSIGISNAAMTFNGPQIENTQLFPTTLPSTDQQENIQASEMSLQLGQPYELRADQEITQAPQLTQNVVESLPCHAPLTQTDQLDIIHPQCAEQNSQENIESQTKSQENPLNDVDSQGIQQLEQENKAQDQQHPQSHTSQDLQPVFKISSITSAAALDVTPQVSNNPLSNKNDDDQEILKDNQEETAIIEGVVEQAKELNLEAQPVTAELPQNMHDNEMEVDDDNYDNEEDDEDEEEEEEDDVNEDENELNDGNNVNDDDSSTLCNNNLEERQNYQNQEVLTQIRPAALALHPYLEDISSSSNSLLSNSLSQTPPPTVTSLSISSQPACSTTATSASAERRLLNTEETENILNESSDALSRRSSIVAATSAAATVGQPLTPSHLAQQLPPHMPTFNFDNINEIAENNNNANIEREQLQDGQHHYHQQQLQQQNQQQTRNTQ